MTTEEERLLFSRLYAERLAGKHKGGSDGGGSGACNFAVQRDEVLSRVREWLESHVPDDFARGHEARKRGTGTFRKTRERVRQMLFPAAKL